MASVNVHAEKILAACVFHPAPGQSSSGDSDTAFADSSSFWFWHLIKDEETLGVR
jgi:hypothetical protein